jgi:ribonuclease HI
MRQLIKELSKQMGMGFLIRDHTGTVRVAKCTTIRFVADPSVAEALAARMGVELCRELEFHDILLEGDAQVMYQV